MILSKSQHKLNGFLIFMLSGFATLGVSSLMIMYSTNFDTVVISFIVFFIGFLQFGYALLLYKQSWELVSQ